jgi:hypothetical protein
VDPPGGNGTTSVMVLDCAQAGVHAGTTANAAVPASTSRLVNFMVVSS